MNKFVKGLLLALAVVAPIAIAAPAVKAQDVHPHKHINVRRNNHTNVRTNKSVKRQHHTAVQTRHIKKHHVNNNPQH